MHAADLRIQDGALAAETHRAYAHLVGFAGQALLQLSDLRVVVACPHFAEQHFLRLDIGRAAVPADRDA